MEQNPYESPKAVEHRPKRRLFVLAFGTVMLIPVGAICGGLAWYLTGIIGETIGGDTFIWVPGNGSVYAGTPGWFLGVPLGLLVMGLTWCLIGRKIWSHP